MNKKIAFSRAAVLGLSVLSACAAPGTEDRADTYQSGQVNQRQALRVITILSVSPARIMVDNARNKQIAQVAGGIIGAGAGIGLGLGVAHSGTAATLGGVGGGVAGALAGSAVPDKTAVNGVQIAYKDGNAMYSSAQVGRLCEFTTGQAMLVATSESVTRIQPNHQCPAPKK